MQVTPLRRRISAHIQSGLHTSGSGFTGWPTPNAGPQNDNDTTWQQRRESMKAKHGNGNGFGMNLGQAAQLASWCSPTARDHKDQSDPATWNCSQERDRYDQLPRQAHLTLGSTSSGSPAPTEKRGQLNPAFSRWLMGYNPHWCDAAILKPQPFRRF
jgi:hypothetical protein